MNNDKLTKVLLVILVIVCVFQGCSISSMNTEIQNLGNRLSDMNRDLSALKYRIDDLEDVVSAQGIQMDAVYKLSKMNLESGMLEVEFEINPANVTDNTRIVVANGNGSFELTKDGNHFSGIVEYPMNTTDYETIVYQYEGDYEKAYQSMDWIGAGALLSEYVQCSFRGFSSYGNQKLTLAGELDFGLYLNKTITSVQLVIGEQKTKLENGEAGTVPVNVSEDIGNYERDFNDNIRNIYVEFVTDEGVSYRVYPYINCGSSHEISNEESSEGDYITQDSWLIVTLPDGTEYEMMIFSKEAEPSEW